MIYKQEESSSPSAEDSFFCYLFLHLKYQNDEATEAAFKDKNSWTSQASKLERRDLNLEIARINGSKIFL